MAEGAGAATRHADAFDALEALYGELRAEIERDHARVRCDLRGVCCDFARSGHVLMATDLEVAFARAHGGGAPPEADAASCPFFANGRCGLRDGRPLGCRVYFCDAGYAAPGGAMEEVAERFHRAVAKLHDRFGVPYRYRRFVDAIREPEGA